MYKQICEFLFKQKLGEGGQGNVFLCEKINRENGGSGSVELVAIKIPKTDNNNILLQNEFTILKKVQHPNIISLKDVRGKTCLIMEYLPYETLKSFRRKNIPSFFKILCIKNSEMV